MNKVNLPEGKSGEWEVSKFKISEEESERSIFSYGSRRPPAGTYTRLMRGSTVVMSDVPAEQRDHWQPVSMASGHVLINGLGIGMVLLNCMKKEGVNKATVVEKSLDVINLVSPTYKKMFGDKLEIIHADCLKWKPPKESRYNMVWHDIWDNICAGNYDEMKTLHRKFGRKSDWQGSWCRYEVKRLQNQSSYY